MPALASKDPADQQFVQTIIARWTQPQIDTILTLAANGFDVTNVYNDDIVRMEHFRNTTHTFVRPDGTITVPRTLESALIAIQLRDDGITIRYGKD